jgi:cytochrome c biogenesis protein CcmG, thiol:disulfide interchange protein DsbE
MPAGRPFARRLVTTSLAVVLTVAAVACGGDDGDDGNGADRLPALELPALDDGASLALDTIDGPAVVNLWATWCAPCRRELPDFQEVHTQRGDEVRFVGVNIGDRPGPAAEFLAEVGVTFENYLDFEGRLSEELRTATMPVTVITDRAGFVAVVHQGPMDVDELNDQIDSALAVVPAS